MTSPLERIGPAVDAAAIMLCVAFLAYVSAILWPFLKRRRAEPGDHRGFTWHLLVPCLNEELVVARTVERLRIEHPAAHVWCVDDASTDATSAILGGLAACDQQVHVVTRRSPQAREGKGPALNAGWSAIRDWTAEHDPVGDRARTIIGVVDADGRLASDALDMIAGPAGFGTPDVGAVQVQVRMLNRGLDPSHPDGDDPLPRGRLAALLVQLQDLEFRTVIAAMQHLRHRIGSVGMGGNGQFTRLAVLDSIAAHHGTPWHGALLEDFELGLHVLLVGARNEYCDDTWVSQEGLPGIRALTRQRTRWAQGGMQCAKYLRPIMRSRGLSTPAALEIGYFLLIPWTQIAGTLVYAATLSTMAFYAITAPSGVQGWLGAGAWGVVPLIAVFGVAPVAIWGVVYRLRCEPSMSRRRAALLGIAYWLYSYLMVAAVWRAFIRIIRSENGWVKTQRVFGAGRHTGSVPRADTYAEGRRAPRSSRSTEAI